MSSPVNNFSLFRYFPEKFKRHIKIINVFNENIGYCVTNDDKVYGLGENIRKYLGYTETGDDKCYVVIRELCGKKIEQFFGNEDVFFAISEHNVVYSWGWNKYGQLGRGFNSDEKLKPEKFDFFTNKNIIQISCGWHNCMALSIDGKVYGWNFVMNKKESFTPIEFQRINERVKSINCFQIKCYGLTFNGRVYFYDEERFMNWDISGECIVDLFFQSGRALCQTNYHLYSKADKLVKTDYNNLFEYFFFRERKTYKTIHLKNSEMFSIELSFNEILNEVNKCFKTIDFNDANPTISSCLFKDIPKTLKSEVKCFYKSINFELFVMKSDMVFVIGSAGDGKLGLGCVDSCDILTIVPELSNECIAEFYEGNHCMFAISEANEIYSWGYNNYGQLARGFHSDECLKPKKIVLREFTKIIQICCQYNHCLALSSDGKVYAWGDNREGRVDCGKTNQKYILNAVLVDFEYPIKFIHCGRCTSFVINTEDKIFYWGKLGNKKDEPGPDILNIDDVAACVHHRDQQLSTLMILTNDKKAFITKDLKEFIRISNKIHVNDFTEVERKFYLESDKSAWEYSPRDNSFRIIDYQNYICSLKIFHKTYHLRSEGYIITKNYKWSSWSKAITFSENVIFDGKFGKDFDLMDLIGEGAFGKVFRVKNKLTLKTFAIKVIEIESNANDLTLKLREISILSEIMSDFVVQYFDSWIEYSGITKIYLLMELCQANLKTLIECSNNFNKCFNIFKFFIGCQLFTDLTRSISYLHSLKPMVIHRDLKPENVLICENSHGILIKLCDFGSAKKHLVSNHTRNVGTITYMAPEVLDGKIYNSKSDIYSLALNVTEIFGFDESKFDISRVFKIKRSNNRNDLLVYMRLSFVNSNDLSPRDKYLMPYLGTEIEMNFKKLLDLVSICLHTDDYHTRPDCNEILEKINEFSLNKNFVLSAKNISDFNKFLENQKITYTKRFSIINLTNRINFVFVDKLFLLFIELIKRILFVSS